MLIAPFAALVLLQLPQQQDPPREPIQDLTPQKVPIAETDAPEWTLVNRVEVIVNEDIITFRDLVARIRRLQATGQLTTEADFRMAETIVLSERIRNLLTIQAGQDLGFPEEMLMRQMDFYMERQVEKAGGVTQLSEALKRQGTGSSERREELAEALYSMTWESIVTGEQPSTDGRPTRDRYVRPGMRKFIYSTLLEQPAQYAQFGGVSPAVKFHYLVIDYQTAGGREAARALTAEVREAAMEGEDFAGLVDTYGSLKGEEALVEANVQDLARVRKELGAFLERAVPGEISPILSAKLMGSDGKERNAWGIARMIQRVEAVPPEFADRGVQQKLHEFALGNYDDQRVDEALRLLYRSAYVWPPKYADGGQR